jgi:hypothetical protein
MKCFFRPDDRGICEVAAIPISTTAPHAQGEQMRYKNCILTRISPQGEYALCVAPIETTADEMLFIDKSKVRSINLSAMPIGQRLAMEQYLAESQRRDRLIANMKASVNRKMKKRSAR